MIMVEFTTETNKRIAFTDNGVLSIKDNVDYVNFSTLNKAQAIDLACAIMKWSIEQPEEKS
jgi:hypothetical protein